MFDTYIYKAIKKQHLTSQNQLAKLLNISTAHMARLKTGQNLPTEETALQVAALAGIAPEVALIDLNLWRAKDDERRLKVWQNISKMIQLSTIIILILLNNQNLFNILANIHNVYYVEYFVFFVLIYQYFNNFTIKTLFSVSCKNNYLRIFQRC